MKWKTRVSFTLLLTVIVFILPSFVFASDSPLTTLFRPLQSLDISNTYDLYHYWVDFFLFLAVFVSISKFTLGRRFGGREGKALSVVVGLALALSLSLLEYRVGFSIKSFGPIAAGIFIRVVGMVMFSLIKAVGVGNTGAGSFAFVITYFLVRSTLSDWLLSFGDNSWFSWLDLGFVIAVIISVGKMVGSFWSKGDMRSLGRQLERSGSSDGINLHRNIDGEKQELFLVKRNLRRMTRAGMSESGDVVNGLQEMVKIIEEFGSTDKARHLIAEKLNQITPKENLILKQLAKNPSINKVDNS